MSVIFNATGDRLSGTTPTGLTTGAFSWGFCWRPSDNTTNGTVAYINQNTTTAGTAYIDVESDGGELILYGSAGASGTNFTFTANTDYYIVISRPSVDTEDRVTLRVFSTSATPDHTSGVGATTDDQDFSGAVVRAYGNAGWFDSSNFEMEAEKWELGVEWSNPECWAEAQKYTLQRAGGTPELECYLTNIDADDQGLWDSVGTLDLTNTSVTNGTNHPNFLETLGSGIPETGVEGMEISDSVSYSVVLSPSTCRIVSTL